MGWSDEEFDRAYDEKLSNERNVRRKRREQLAKHRKVIASCNVLLVVEAIALVILIVALILHM